MGKLGWFGWLMLLLSVVVDDLLDGGDYALYVFVGHHWVERYAHDALVDALGNRTEAFLVAHLLVEREEVDRNVVDLALDVLGAHGVEELTASAGELIKLKLNDVQVPCCVGLRDLFLDEELRDVGEGFVISLYDLFSSI